MSEKGKTEWYPNIVNAFVSSDNLFKILYNIKGKVHSLRYLTEPINRELSLIERLTKRKDILNDIKLEKENLSEIDNSLRRISTKLDNTFKTSIDVMDNLREFMLYRKYYESI